MRWLVLLWLATGCGRLAFDRTAALDPDAEPTVDGSRLGPAFVQNFEHNCMVAQRCDVAVSNTSLGTILLATVTYNPPSLEVTSVADDFGRPFSRLIGPIDWAPGNGDYHSELWWIRNEGASSVVVTVSGTTSSLLNVYVDEFVATAVDQTAAASGSTPIATTVSSGSRDITTVPALIFGHGEGQGPTVYPAVGFTLHSNANSNVEETKAISVPGPYDAEFTINSAGDWVALMAVLR